MIPSSLLYSDSIPVGSWDPGPGPWMEYVTLHRTVLTKRLSIEEEDKLLYDMGMIWAKLEPTMKKWVGDTILGSSWKKETVDGLLPPLHESIWKRLGAGKKTV